MAECTAAPLLLPSVKIFETGRGACGFMNGEWKVGRLKRNKRFLAWEDQRRTLKKQMRKAFRSGRSTTLLRAKLKRLRLKNRRLERKTCSLLENPLFIPESGLGSSQNIQNRLVLTQAMDVVREVIDSAQPRSFSPLTTRNAPSSLITGVFKGRATLTGNLDEDAIRDGTIFLEEFQNRFGYQPSQGDLVFNLEITETTITGTISTTAFNVGNIALAFVLTYDLTLVDGNWAGRVQGSMKRLDDMEDEPIDEQYDNPVLVALTAAPLVDGKEVDSDTLTTPGKVRVKYWVLSNAPVNWVNTMWDSPLTNLTGGGSGKDYCRLGECGSDNGYMFQEVEKGYWMYYRDYDISASQPNGTYTWSSSVKNASELSSEEKIVRITFTGGQADITPPTLHSVSVTTSNLGNGTPGLATLHVVGKSADEITFLTNILDGPLGNVQGGGSSAQFTECTEVDNAYCEGLGEGYWYHSESFHFSKWAPNGTYHLYYISVETDAHIPSEQWAETLTFDITGNPTATQPIITNVDLFYYAEGASVPTTISDGSCLKAAQMPDPLVVGIQITATSDAPVNWINSSLDGPSGNLHGGGSSVTFTEITGGTWRAEKLHFIDAPLSAPKGTYEWTTSVKNEGERTSEQFGGPLTFNLKTICP